MHAIVSNTIVILIFREIMGTSVLFTAIICIALMLIVAAKENGKKHEACVKGAQLEHGLCNQYCNEMKEELELQPQCFKNCNEFLLTGIDRCNKENSDGME